MLDANGRPIEVGDWIATPWPKLSKASSARETVGHLDTIIGATLGQVTELGTSFEGEFVYLGDGIAYAPSEIVTLGGIELVTCPECGETWGFDVRMNAEEECPSCDYLLCWHTDEHLISDPEPICEHDPDISYEETMTGL